MSLLGIITRTALGLAPAPAPAPAPAAHAIAPIVPLIAAPTATAAAPAGAVEVVDKVQQFYANIKQVSASFRQSVTNSTFGTTKTNDGAVWIMKPGKMRWDYLDSKEVVVAGTTTKKTEVKVKKSFISNGKYLYVVEHDNKQVMKKSLQQDLMPVAVSFLTGTGDLKAEFNPELDTSGKYGGKDDLVLKLSPKQPSAQYKNLYLVVSRSDFHVSQSVIIDSSSNVNHFRFFAPDFEKPIKPTSFEFDERSVRSYRVIDADSPKDGAGAPRLDGPLIAPAPAPAKP